jgi:hypothetical protein
MPFALQYLPGGSVAATCVQLAGQWLVCGGAAGLVRVWSWSGAVEAEQRAANAKAARVSWLMK